MEEDSTQIENKELILKTIKASALSMQQELVKIMSVEYSKKIQDVQQEKKKVENHKNDQLKKSSLDSS